MHKIFNQLQQSSRDVGSTDAFGPFENLKHVLLFELLRQLHALVVVNWIVPVGVEATVEFFEQCEIWGVLCTYDDFINKFAMT